MERIYEDQGETELPPSIAAPLPSPPNDDFFKFRIDGSDILEDMEHRLKGEVLDERGEWVKRFEPWLNEEGINKVLHIVYSCGVNKNVFLGNLSKDEINFKCNLLKKKLALLFFKKAHDYGLRKEMRSLMISTIMDPINSGLSRSEGGRESDQISTAAQRYDMYQHAEQPKRSIANRLSFFGKR